MSDDRPDELTFADMESIWQRMIAAEMTPAPAGLFLELFVSQLIERSQQAADQAMTQALEPNSAECRDTLIRMGKLMRGIVAGEAPEWCTSIDFGKTLIGFTASVVVTHIFQGSGSQDAADHDSYLTEDGKTRVFISQVARELFMEVFGDRKLLDHHLSMIAEHAMPARSEAAVLKQTTPEYVPLHGLLVKASDLSRLRKIVDELLPLAPLDVSWDKTTQLAVKWAQHALMQYRKAIARLKKKDDQ